MKLESYHENLVIVNQNTSPERHGVCGNDGHIIFHPPQLREKFLAEHAALVAVSEAAANFKAAYIACDDDGMEMTATKLDEAFAALAEVRAGSEVGK